MSKKIIAITLIAVILSSLNCSSVLANSEQNINTEELSLVNEDISSTDQSEVLESDLLQNQAGDALLNNNQLEKETGAEVKIGAKVKTEAKTQAKADASQMTPFAVLPGGEVTPTSWEDFKDTIENADGSKTIHLDNLDAVIPTTSVNITINHNYDIVIDGGNKTLTAPSGSPHFKIANPNSGKITFCNMTLQRNTNQQSIQMVSGTYSFNNVKFAVASGSSYALNCGPANAIVNSCEFTGGAGITIGTGTLSITDSLFDQMSGNAISGSNTSVISVSNATFKNGKESAIAGGINVTIDNSLFENNTAETGAAMNLANNAVVTVKDSSFIGNKGTAGGYNGGAISAEQVSPAMLTLEKCYFEGNISSQGYMNTATTGVGGHGGAVSLYNGNGNLTVKKCYFKANETTGPSITSDGGAIAFFGPSGGTGNIIIEDSTFDENVASDDAGAVFVQGSSNVVAKITNNTFYGNIGKQYDGNGTGGAIQFSVTGTFAAAPKGILTNNTFYKNSITGDEGNDVGYHLRSAYTFQNNLFVGEGSATKSGINVKSSTSTNNGGNLGLDYNSVRPSGLTVKSVFGTETPNRVVTGQVGKDGAYPMFALIIAPRGSDVNSYYAESAGTGTAGIANVSAVDARGIGRGNPIDTGAIDIGVVRFDATEGAWSGLDEAGFYDGHAYYEDDTASSGYHLVSTPDGNVTSLGGTSNHPVPEREGYIFAGWNTLENGEGNDYLEAVDVHVSVQTLYAMWELDIPSYQITYDGNRNDGGTVPEDSDSYVTGDSVSILTGEPTKTGYTFSGWHNSQDDKIYKARTELDRFEMGTDNVVLTATWTENPITYFTVTYHANGGTGEIPRDPLQYEKDARATVFNQGQLQNSGYSFAGWNTAGDGSGAVYQPDEQIVMLGNIELFAQWEKDNNPPTPEKPKQKEDPKPKVDPTPIPKSSPKATPNTVVSKPNSNLKVVKTSDNNNIVEVGIVTIVSMLIGLGAAVSLLKRRNYN